MQGLNQTARADTIDYWHVYYNKIKIKEYNLNTRETVILKARDIKKADKLVIKYFRDTPCNNCESAMTIENDKHVVILKGMGRGTFNPVGISLYDLLQHHIRTKENIYSVFYNEGQHRLEKEDPIFKIKLE
ncbi:hypothetical protein [Niabella hibiscisoli]|uniref:hypothetical protein n=1 Tax=Niabella hibiscisoli TaxID=1825928 RepID=UPI001F0E9120|nr:hypothetical protein [Niabella hibiscisoli]MCH5716410.1 hypothetical protein [Niabella hibiscisoli]